MGQNGIISGFSRFSRQQKTKWLSENYHLDSEEVQTLLSHLHDDSNIQERYENFSENTVSNFFLPYGLAPNFLINDKWHVLPMAIEESSVVAAASHAAKFWAANGGFKAEVIDTIKIGQVHFSWTGSADSLISFFNSNKKELLQSIDTLNNSMARRGGGIADMYVKDMTKLLPDYYQLYVEFHTADAMGANFINSCLEALSKEWSLRIEKARSGNSLYGEMDIDMAILSNYTPDCLVKIWVESNVSALDSINKKLTGTDFARKFVRATKIAHTVTHRAVTHNKGIFNGMDAVIIATGNDFRAVEACGHAYAARNGIYQGLSTASLDGSIFRFEMEVPLSVGTVGGLTSAHPMAKLSLKLLDDPSADQLMIIIAAAGLANNFSALSSLITSGIQHGHMKMHLSNILYQLEADEEQKNKAMEHFRDRIVTFADVKKFIENSNT